MFTTTILPWLSTIRILQIRPIRLHQQPSWRSFLFRLPGGGGTYNAGTSQIVSWSWPTGSHITSIKAVNICQGSGLRPSHLRFRNSRSFTSNQPDRGGAIPVQLPYSISSGSYVFRVTVTPAEPTAPSIAPVPFTAVGGVVNGNQCALGDSLCFNGSFIAPCIEQGAGDPAEHLGFGRASQCPGKCIQIGNKGSCVLGGRGNGGGCTARAMKCTSPYHIFAVREWCI